MAGKIIADTIESAGSQISLNVGNVTILTASSTGLTLIPTTNVNVNLTNSIVTLTNGSATSPGLTFSGNTRTGLFMPSANTLAFTAANTESMRIDSSGNVGIGTNSPGNKLHISGATNGASGISIQSTGASGRRFTMYSDSAGGLVWYDDSGSAERMRISSAGKVGIGNSSPEAQNLHVGPSAGGGSINGYTRFAVESNDYAVTTIKAPAANFSQIIFTDPTSSNLGGINFFNSSYSTPNAMTFLTGGGNERMRIDSSGNLFVNQTAQTGAEKVGISFDRGGSWGLAIKNTSSSAPSNATYVSFYYTSTNTGSINSTGTTTSYGTSSDYRLKESITPITNALSKVSELKPSNWFWKSNGSTGQGFIAHELQEVIPDAVIGTKDQTDEDGNPHYQCVDTSFLVATLTAAIQELKAIVDAQAVEIAALKAK